MGEAQGQYKSDIIFDPTQRRESDLMILYQEVNKNKVYFKIII